MLGGSGFVAAWLVMESTGNENPGEIGSTLFSTSACMAQCRTGRAGAKAGVRVCLGAGVGKGKNEVVSDTKSLLLRGSGRQRWGWGQHL